MKKRTLKIATLIKVLAFPLLLSGCDNKNTCEIPSYVDTSRTTIEELNEQIALEDSLFNLPDSLQPVLDSTTMVCGADGRSFLGWHDHSGSWVDEDGTVYPWFNAFKNSVVCPICHLRYDDYELDKYGFPNLSKPKKK
tara:strand:+ start:303 stop:716 length:414 start_codon:yes stop_codon:yes gene_type:complete